MTAIFLHLREPLWLLLSLVPVFLLVFAWLRRRRQSHAYADPHFYDWVITSASLEHRHRFVRLLLILLAWTAFAIALAGPRLPEKIQDSEQQYFREVMVVIDLSLSMSARDIKPSRIERARLELLDLVERAENLKLGLVVFSARPHLLTPVTSDKQALRYYLNRLRPQLLPTEGSSLFQALKFAADQLQKSASPAAILLVSDGDINLTAEQARTAFEEINDLIKERQISLYTLGLGSRQGAPLLSGQAGWLQVDNQTVISRINEPLLEKIAGLGNGEYSPAYDDDRDWSRLYDNGIAQLQFQDQAEKLDELIIWSEHYHWFIVAGLIFLLTSQLLARPATAQPQSYSVILLATVLSGLLMSSPMQVYASEQYRQAYTNFQQGNYQSALELFAKVPGYQGRFAEAGVAYKLEQYQRAIPLYIQAILDANNSRQRSAAIFNLANSYYRLERYAEAAKLYEDVLRYQPDFQAARTNREHALALIKKFEQQEGAVARRQGKGPRTADAPDDLDITTGKVSLDDSESTGSDSVKRDHADTLTGSTSLTLEHSAPASKKIERHDDVTWTYDIKNIKQLQQLNPNVQTDESVLWQRLFEIEEGFEAAQDQPNQLPGIDPW